MLVRGMYLVMRAMGSRFGPAMGAAVARGIGPLTPTHRIALANLRLAFPERDEAWIAATAREAWDNLGRTACEYVHLPAIMAGTTPQAHAALPPVYWKDSDTLVQAGEGTATLLSRATGP